MIRRGILVVVLLALVASMTIESGHAGVGPAFLPKDALGNPLFTNYYPSGGSPKLAFLELFSSRATLDEGRSRMLSPNRPEWTIYSAFESVASSLGFQVIDVGEGATESYVREMIETSRILVLPPVDLVTSPPFDAYVDDIVESVQKGTALLICGDGDIEIVNSLLRRFGAEFEERVMVISRNPPTAGYPENFVLTNITKSHPAMAGVDQITVNYMSPIHLLNDTHGPVILAETPSDTYIAGRPSESGPFIHSVAVEYGAGKVLVFGDDGFKGPPYYLGATPWWGRILINSLAWLSGSNASASGSTLPRNETTRGNFTTEVVLSGLSNPYVHAADSIGRIYFSESNETGSILRRFNPMTGKVYDLVSHLGYVTLVSPDSLGNVYYVLQPMASPGGNELWKLSAETGRTEVLYSTRDPTVLLDMAVDPHGNIFFSTTQAELIEGRVVYSPPAKIWSIPRGSKEASCLLQLANSSIIRNLSISTGQSPDLYFSAEYSDKVCVQRFVGQTLSTILQRPASNHGSIACATLDDEGNLYYLYRQRSEVPGEDLWGSVEVGLLDTHESGNHSEPLVLLEERLNGTAAMCMPVRGFFYAGTSGELLFSIGEYYANGTLVSELVLLDRQDLSQTELLTTEQSTLPPFAVDQRGDVYVSIEGEGTIKRIVVGERATTKWVSLTKFSDLARKRGLNVSYVASASHIECNEPIILVVVGTTEGLPEGFLYDFVHDGGSLLLALDGLRGPAAFTLPVAGGLSNVTLTFGGNVLYDPSLSCQGKVYMPMAIPCRSDGALVCGFNLNFSVVTNMPSYFLGPLSTPTLLVSSDWAKTDEDVSMPGAAIATCSGNTSGSSRWVAIADPTIFSDALFDLYGNKDFATWTLDYLSEGGASKVLIYTPGIVPATESRLIPNMLWATEVPIALLGVVAGSVLLFRKKKRETGVRFGQASMSRQTLVKSSLGVAMDEVARGNYAVPLRSLAKKTRGELSIALDLPVDASSHLVLERLRERFPENSSDYKELASLVQELDAIMQSGVRQTSRAYFEELVRESREMAYILKRVSQS
jgi:hypothetical protein